MFRWAAFLGLIGLFVATGVIVWTGWTQVLQALAQAGFVGILVTSLVTFLPLMVSALSWQVLCPGKARPSFWSFLYFMWIRASVNNLMPVARIGGEIAVVRIMADSGMRRNTAIAITIAELTISVMAVFVFVCAGVFFFAMRISDTNLVALLASSLLVTVPIIAALLLVQKIGFFGLMLRVFRLMFRNKWAGITGSAAKLDRAVASVYRRTNRVLVCCVLQLLAWGMGTIEIWVALQFLDHPFSWGDSFILEALIQGSSSAAFAVPGALGVQEAGFLFFGGLLGLPANIATALAVMRRCRDLICYVPGLITWQMHEGKKLLRE